MCICLFKIKISSEDLRGRERSLWWVCHSLLGLQRLSLSGQQEPSRDQAWLFLRLHARENFSYCASLIDFEKATLSSKGSPRPAHPEVPQQVSMRP